MRVQIVNPDHAAGLIDPITRRSPFLTDDGKLVAIADVPENTFWVRRILDGSITRIETTTPTGNAPIAPLTTR